MSAPAAQSVHSKHKIVVKAAQTSMTFLLIKMPPHWRSFATSANFNLEHNRSVFNAVSLSLRIHSPQRGVNKTTNKLNAIASFLAMTATLSTKYSFKE